MQLDIDNENDREIRGFTASLRADHTTEGHIQALYKCLEKSIDGFAYILHDKDLYTDAEIKEIDSRWTKLKAEGREPDFFVPTEDTPRPDHWHIVCSFKYGVPISRIAHYLNCDTNMIEILRNKGKNLGGGFGNMLAYLTHITKDAREAGKFEYDSDEVKMLQFPTKRNGEVFKDFKDYDDFRIAYEAGVLKQEDYIDQILHGTLTPRELLKSHGRYYIDHIRKIKEAQRAYVKSLPFPKQVFNYFVGTYDFDPNAQTGRIGKDLVSLIQAIACLKMRFPDVDFDEIMSLPEEEAKTVLADRWIFWAGGAGVGLQSYAGQPIIIWSDVRAEGLIRAFGGVEELFKAIDDHPSPKDLNIKFDAVQLKNSVNIFNGAQSYAEFIDSLREEYISQMGYRMKKDASQAKGRFPFIIEISPSVITQRAELNYFASSLKDMSFSRTFANQLRDIAQNNMIAEASTIIGEPFIEIEKAVLDNPTPDKKLTAYDIEHLCDPIPEDELPDYVRKSSNSTESKSIKLDTILSSITDPFADRAGMNKQIQSTPLPVVDGQATIINAQ